MTILFSNSSSKIPKQEIFGPKFKDFYFCTKLCNKKNLRALISNIALVFTNSRPKILKSGIFGPKFKDFKNLKTLQSCKFEGVDFKYDNVFFQKHPNKVFFQI